MCFSRSCLTGAFRRPHPGKGHGNSCRFLLSILYRISGEKQPLSCSCGNFSFRPAALRTEPSCSFPPLLPSPPGVPLFASFCTDPTYVNSSAGPALLPHADSTRRFSGRRRINLCCQRNRPDTILRLKSLDFNRSGTVLRTPPFCAAGTKSVSCELQRAFGAIKCFFKAF